MRKTQKLLPSPALVVALMALFISLGGTAVAAGIVPLAKRALVADKLANGRRTRYSAGPLRLPARPALLPAW